MAKRHNCSLPRGGNLEKSASIIFFSGTGGVKRIASEFAGQLEKKLFTVSSFNIDYSREAPDFRKIDEAIASSSYVFLLFPLHSFDAPELIYLWIRKAKAVSQKMVVLSVSAGGEAWPNLGTRVDCINALEEKGFLVIYEKMMVMPSNWFYAINDHAALWLLKVIPEKTGKILDAVLAGKIRRTGPKRKGFFQSFFTKLKKEGATLFVKSLKIDDRCNRCLWCVKNCPVKNISIGSGKPFYLHRCIMCFRCIYGCPAKAITSKNVMVLKGGYDLTALEKRMEGLKLKPVQECCPGLIMKGIRNYLLDIDGY